MRFPFHCLIITIIHFLQFAPQIAKAQQIPAVGTDITLDVATWNIEWFGSDSNGPSDDDRQIANVRAVIEQAGIDLWGLQEIADPADFNALLDALGDGYDGVLATESGRQRIGFLYNTEIFSNVVIQHILSSFAVGSGNPFAGRAPFQLEADVTLVGETWRLTFIVLHMKCCSDASSYNRRVEASQRLKNNLDILRPFDPIIILGDFNDELTGSIRSGQPSPYDNFLQDDARYFFPSLSIEQSGFGTFCGNSAACSGGSTIDHILVTDELIALYQTDSAARFDELLSGLSNYVLSTSDHLPVFARFGFPIARSTEDAAVPEAVVLEPAYPNPVRHRATLAYTLPRPATVRLDVFDALGRRIQTLVDGFVNTGTHRATFEAAHLPPGVYTLRLSAGTFVATQRVVRVR